MSSGGARQQSEKVREEDAEVRKDDENAAPPQPIEDVDSKILAARERFLARRGTKK